VEQKEAPGINYYKSGSADITFATDDSVGSALAGGGKPTGHPAPGVIFSRKPFFGVMETAHTHDLATPPADDARRHR
jgi:hypothetical protein